MYRGVSVLLILCLFVCSLPLRGTSFSIKRNHFETYWNIPTFQCLSHNITFVEVAKKYGIHQNDGDKFRGDIMTILYDPGAFPAILTTRKTRETVLRNGGVPQEGSVPFHLTEFSEAVEKLIPNRKFAGVGIIDFESWRPIFRQNFGTLTLYKELSRQIERERHPLWPSNAIEKEAERRFELHGREFMEETLNYVKRVRPKALWGYYGYPYCFNMNPNTMQTDCPLQVIKENDRIAWLFNNVDQLNPSLYIRENNLNSTQRLQLIAGRINESHRIIGNLQKPVNPPIIPYFWYKYQDSGNFLRQEDISKSFVLLRDLQVNGLILWGSSNDVNTKAKCQSLYDYIDTVLGPALVNL